MQKTIASWAKSRFRCVRPNRIPELRYPRWSLDCLGLYGSTSSVSSTFSAVEVAAWSHLFVVLSCGSWLFTSSSLSSGWSWDYLGRFGSTSWIASTFSAVEVAAWTFLFVVLSCSFWPFTALWRLKTWPKHVQRKRFAVAQTHSFPRDVCFPLSPRNLRWSHKKRPERYTFDRPSDRS